MFLGALSGGFSNAVLNRVYKGLGYKPNDKQLSTWSVAALNLLNSNKLTGIFRHTYNEAATTVGLINDLKEAIDKGDVFKYKNLQKQNFFNFVLSGVKTNRFDLRLQQLEDLKTLDPKQFAELTESEFTEDNKNLFNEYVDNLISEAKSMKASIDKVNRVFVNKNDAKTNPLEYNIYEDYKDALAYSIALTDDSLNRIDKLSGEVSQMFPGVDMNKAVNLVNFRGVKQTVSEFTDRLAELKSTYESLDPKSNLAYDTKKEINFLEDMVKTLSKTLTYNESIEALQPLMDKNGRVNTRPIENRLMRPFENNISYERDLGRALQYLADGTVTDTVHRSELDPIARTQAIRKLQDIFKLDIQGRTATKYYNSLATNKGFSRFKNRTIGYIKSYSSRISIDDQGNFVYKTDAQVEAEREALLNGIAKAREVLAKQEAAALPEEDATVEEKNKISEIVNKEAKGEE